MVSYGAFEHSRVRKSGLRGGVEINNKVLLYSTGNYSQYPMINHKGKECKKRMYIRITESLCCRAEINTTL